MILRRRWWPYFNFNLLLCWSRYRLKEEFRSFIGFFFLIHVTSIVLRVTETAMFQYKLMVNFFSFIFELVVKLDWGLRMRTFFFFFFLIQGWELFSRAFSLRAQQHHCMYGLLLWFPIPCEMSCTLQNSFSQHFSKRNLQHNMHQYVQNGLNA